MSKWNPGVIDAKDPIRANGHLVLRAWGGKLGETMVFERPLPLLSRPELVEDWFDKTRDEICARLRAFEDQDRA